jgi:hypothetical protein
MVVSFEVGEGSMKHFPARHDDDVETASHFVTPENLSCQALGSVTFYRRAYLARRRHPEASRFASVGGCEDRHELTVCPSPSVVNALELRPAADTFRGRQLLAAHADSVKVRLTLVGYCQPMPALCATPFENNAPVLGGHSDPESVGLLAPPIVGLEGTLAFHAGSYRLLRSSRAVWRGTVNTSRGSTRVSTNELIGALLVLQSPASPHDRIRREVPRFGLFPKISTPVEKTVENRIS